MKKLGFKGIPLPRYSWLEYKAAWRVLASPGLYCSSISADMTASASLGSSRKLSRNTSPTCSDQGSDAHEVDQAQDLSRYAVPERLVSHARREGSASLRAWTSLWVRSAGLHRTARTFSTQATPASLPAPPARRLPWPRLRSPTASSVVRRVRTCKQCVHAVRRIRVCHI